MLLCFVDESFRGDFYGFGGIVADEYATKKLTGELNQLVSQVGIDFGIPATTELHGYPMFHGENSWSRVGVRARIRAFEKAIDAVLATDVTILFRSVSRSRLLARQSDRQYEVAFPPEQVAFQHILQRAQRVAERRQTHVLVIADERPDRDRHREHFAIYQTQGTPGVHMYTTLDRLLDTVHFAPSKQSRMLQAADLLTFMWQRRALVPTEKDYRAEIVVSRIWNKIVGSGRCFDIGQWPSG